MSRACLKPKAAPQLPEDKRPLPMTEKVSVAPNERKETGAQAQGSHPGKFITGADILAVDRSRIPICRKYKAGGCPTPCQLWRAQACSSCDRQGHGVLDCARPAPAPPWARPQKVPRGLFEL